MTNALPKFPDENDTELPSAWFEDFLKESGALLEEQPRESRVDALIPTPLAQQMETDFVSFSRAPGADALFASGSIVWERALDVALAQGTRARWHLWRPIKKTFTVNDVERDTSLVGRVKDFKAKQVYTPLALCHFHLCYISDDKREETLHVMIHPALDRGLPADPYRAAVVSQTNELDLPEETVPPAAGVYATAVRTALMEAEPRREFHRARENRRCERESARVRGFFVGAEQDLAKRLARPGLLEEKKQALTNKIRALQLEKTKKLTDVREKHRLTVQIQLVNVGVVYTPQIRGDLILESRGVSLPVTLYWDPFFNQVLLPSCPQCHGLSTRMGACPKQRRLVCAEDLNL